MDFGAVSSVGERLPYKQDVTGSNPVPPTRRVWISAGSRCYTLPPLGSLEPATYYRISTIGKSISIRRAMAQGAVCVFLALTALSPSVWAKDTAIDGPEAPIPPAVLSRDTQGRVTVRATRLAEPIVVDGRLAELIYRQVPSMTEFIQQEPLEGELATEQTEVWVFFDDDNVYVSARCWDSQPEKIVANEMRRDNRNIFNNANFAVIFDTFYDRRNGFLFYTNPLGAIFDAQVTDERNLNSDWNTVWDVKTGRWERGWLVEIKIPFRSLRYRGADSEIWGINFRRIVRWKNETSYLTPVAAAFRQGGIAKLSQAATMVGLETPSRAINLELKPYATAAADTDFEADPLFENELDGNVGFDLKYGVTRGLTFDFTLNTDFAQVEADEQQVNLTRFGLFFPEKRDFFLEGKDIFAFGGVGTRQSFERADNTPIMFFSRQIGLYDEEVVPINAGARLTGRAGAYTLGLLAIQTDELPQLAIPTTDFGVVRVKRDVLRRSNIGIIGTYRSPVFEANDTNDSNQLLGVDGNFTFYQNVNINAYYARSETTGLSGDNASYRGRFQYGGDSWGFEAEHLVVEENFNPEIGFLRRDDIQQSFAELRFNPRPQWSDAIRKFTIEGYFDYTINNGNRQLESQQAQFSFGIDFESGDRFFSSYTQNFEFLDEEFDITDDVIIPIGEYRFNRYEAGFRFGPQRRVSGWIGLARGSFYSGDQTELFYFGRWELTKQLSLEPRLSFNWVDLPEGSFTADVARLRVNYMISPRIFLGALIQYNSSDELAATNIRFRWEYQPGSDFFIVYSDGRDTLRLDPRGIPRLETQSLIIKFTRLFRF